MESASDRSSESRVFQRVVVTGALIGAGFVAGLLALRPSIDGVGRLTDGQKTFTAYDAAVRKVVYEEDPRGPRFVLPEGVQRYAVGEGFIVAQFGERGSDAELLVASLPLVWGAELGSWRAIPELAGASDEVSPVLSQSAAGDELLFASDRAGAIGGLDLWSSRIEYGERSTPKFSEPAALRELNTPFDERDPAPLSSAVGGGLVFVREGDLYLQSAPGLAPARMDVLSSDRIEAEPAAGEYGLYFRREGKDESPVGQATFMRSAFTAPSAEEPKAWRTPRPVVLPSGMESARAPMPSADETRLELVDGGSVRSLRSRPLELRPGANDLALWILLGLLLLLALLASLSHRWRGLEIVTKCLLLSLLLHLLALWAMRYLYPADAEPLPEESAPRIRLRLDAPSDGPSARNAARGGSLEGLTELAPSEVSEPAPPAFTVESRASEALAALNPAAFTNVDTPLPQVEAPSMPRAARAPESFGEAPANDTVRIAEAALERSLSDAPTMPLASNPIAPRGLTGSRPSELSGRRTEVGSLESFTPAVPALSERASGVGTIEAPPISGVASLVAAAPSAGLVPPTTRSGGSEGAAFAPSTSAATDLGDLRIDAPVIASRTGTSSEAPPESSFDFEPRGFETSQPSSRADDALTPPAMASFDDSLARSAARELGVLEPPAVALDSAPKLTVIEPPEPVLLVPPSARLESAPLVVADSPPPADFDDPFAARFGDLKEEALERLGGSKETEAAVARGLAYLAERQTEWGAFGTTRDLEEKYGDTRVGKTGLALLAFLGAGHLPESESPYSSHVTRGIAWLCNNQVEPGEQGEGHFGDTSAYGHAIATYAISEAYALQPLPDLVPYLRRAVRRIESEQQRSRDARFDGGWGYYYPDGHIFDRWPRVSVTSWQVMALCSAKRAGMEVDESVLEAARGFLKGAWDERRGAYRYTHDPERLSSNMPILPGSTGAALFALSLLGEDPGSDEYAEARSYLVERRPRSYGYEGDRSFVQRAQGNLYFSYTASLALIAAGQESDWRRYNLDMTETLLEAQRDNGSWEPDSPYAEYAQDTRRDRIYTTAISVLCLEVYYRYLTPLVKPFARALAEEGE